MHPRANVFAADTCEADTGGHEVVTMDQGCGAGFIDGFANCCGAFADADAKRVGGPGGAFAEHSGSIQHHGARSRSASVYTHYQLSPRRKPPGQNVDSLHHSRHLNSMSGRAPEISILGKRESIMETKRSYSCNNAS